MKDFKARIGLGRQFMSAACLLFVLAAATSAYSVVLRGGKRIEIPAQFSVTNMTLTLRRRPAFGSRCRWRQYSDNGADK